MSRVGVRSVFGSMECGGGLKEAQAHDLLKKWVDKGYNEVDTALMYQGGKTEKIIGKLKLCRDPNKVKIACKANPKNVAGFSSEGIVHQLEESLASLSVPSCDLFYLHWPDHETPIEETLKGVDQLYRDGKFQRFGLSNYASWEVMEIYQICKLNNYVLPSVYQGMYNAFTRDIELELLPCIRKLGMQLYAYNPLAGGLLSGKYSFEMEKKPTGRFSGQPWSNVYQARFWKQKYFEGIDLVNAALKNSYGEEVGLLEASLRWMYHHSQLADNDAVILGFSKAEHFDTNLQASLKGPLSEEVVAEFQKAYDSIKSGCPLYNR